MVNKKEISEYQRLLTELSDVEFDVFVESLTEEEQLSFLYDLEWQGRPKQQLPPDPWTVWLILSGRGFGKTFLGAKVTPKWALTEGRIALVGNDIGEVRDVMIDGESGILALARPDFVPVFNKTLCQLTYPNGAKVQGFSAQEPESLRGPNNAKAWVDELFKYRYQQEVWDELIMTMRSGNNPQIIVTSTPRPTALCKALVADKTTVTTRGSTYENTQLPPKFREEIIAKYEGTRRGRQELYGEILEDNPGALWKLVDIEGPRHHKQFYLNEDGGEVRWLDEMDRVVVAIDPATTSGEDSDETGIIVAGRKGKDGYVFCDETMKGTPKAWGEKAVEVFKSFDADRIVAEVNQGGDMVEAIIRDIDNNIPYKKVHATRGKAIRAEPIAALYEQHRIHHIGYFGELEDELLNFNPNLGKNQKSPNRMDALVWAFTELFGEDVKGPPQIFFL